jgi:OOP family OmpA-OmpF porin
MLHGFGLTYTTGLTPHTDLALSVNGSFGNAPIGNHGSSGSDNFLLEADASGNFKMLSENATFNPYLIAGVGASKYTNIYGAFIPLGGGFKFNIFNEALINVHLQYRIPVISDANAYHFQIGFGIGGLISERKQSL